MKRLFFAACAVVLATAALGVNAADQESPTTVAGATTIDTAKAKALFDKQTAFIDVRSTKDWDAGRIPGAEHLANTEGKLTEESLAKTLGGKDKEVVFYCNGHKCMRSSQAATDALKWGFKNVYYYRDGFPAWQASGNPVE